MDAILRYDGSFSGWLTCVFEIYERRLNNITFYRPGHIQSDIFSEPYIIAADGPKADRVYTGLQKHLSAEALEQLYHAFLSELPDIENVMFAYVRYVFSSQCNVEKDFGHPAILHIAQTARTVWREKHRMEAFIRFQELKENLFYAVIEPEYNVLPLITSHFRDRYKDQDWLIFDRKRQYGVLYKHATQQADLVTITEGTGNHDAVQHSYSEQEALYQLLWKDYFKSTGIPVRKNLKLHLHHMPKRYWKHLTEKQQ